MVALHEDFQGIKQLLEGLWVDCLREGFVGQDHFELVIEQDGDG